MRVRSKLRIKVVFSFEPHTDTPPEVGGVVT